jgi:tetratricopeptide (TPR) repeat protein
MKKLITLAVVMASSAVLAQDLGLYNRALSAFNAGNHDGAAGTFYELTENSTDPDIRAKSEYYLAQSLFRKDLPVSAYAYYYSIVKAGPEHPFYLKAVEGLVNVQDRLEDQYLIPSILNREYNDAWVTLPLEVLARINYLIGAISQRTAKLEEARDFLSAVPRETQVYAKAQYLLGVVYVDPRFPGGAKNEEAIKAFETVLALPGTSEELVETKDLARLGLGRTYYNLGEYQKSTEAYGRIDRFTDYWDEALFENGFARFQNDDFGGALGSLQALHAPQFSGAFQPESWVLKSTIYYFSCLYEESSTALKSFDEIYLPMADRLRSLLEGEERDLSFYYQLVASEGSMELPRPVLLWVRSNERMLGLFNFLSQIGKEKRILMTNPAWQGSKMGPDMVTYLDQNKNTLTQVAGQFAKNRLQEAMESIKLHSDNAEIIRFEVSKAEKELFEAGIDQSKILGEKTLYRPAMPAEDWNYWKFQGEFWIDEIGYYQYTLKKGCADVEQQQ